MLVVLQITTDGCSLHLDVLTSFKYAWFQMGWHGGAVVSTVTSQ